MGDAGDRGGFGEQSDEAKDLNEWAPVPGRPALYPPNSRYYRIPITFELELIAPPPAAPNPAAAAASDAQGAAS